MFKLFLGVATCLAICVASAEPTRVLKRAELSGLRIWGQDNYSFTSAGDGMNLIYSAGPRFLNRSRLELASIKVRLIVDQDGTRIYTSAPVAITQFDNYGAPHTGSLLPIEKSDYLFPQVKFKFPSRYWTTQSSPQLQIAGATTFVNPDLHDVGHLYSFFANSTDEVVLARLKSDPSLTKVTGPRGMSATLAAFGACGTPVIRYLLSHGGSTKASPGGTTIMHMASVNTNAGVQDLALSLGGTVNATTKNGNAAIHKAVVGGARPCWLWLLKHHANPNILDAWGRSPLELAVLEGQKEAVQDLAKGGANVHFRDKSGCGLMEDAVLNPFMFDSVQTIGAGVNDRDPKTGRTPLMFAAGKGYSASVGELLRRGADLKQKDKRGFTAFDYAKTSNTLHTDAFFRKIVQENRP